MEGGAECDKVKLDAVVEFREALEQIFGGVDEQHLFLVKHQRPLVFDEMHHANPQ